MVTSPLGLVPRELEELWPASHYDIPVTGEWDGDELELIHKCVKSLVSNNGYKMLINHSGIDFDSDEIGVEIIDTRQGEGAGSHDALQRLKQASEDAAKKYHLDYRMNEKQQLLIKMRSISLRLHNNDDWLENAHVGGKPPRWKILVGKQQLAMWHPQDGRFAFPKGTLPNLAKCGTLSEVHLEDGPKLEGDIFSPMVNKVIGDIRVGDEVLLFRAGNLLGSARSVTAKWEYFGSPGRVAKTKHRL
jgi:archaeosine synthase